MKQRIASILFLISPLFVCGQLFPSLPSQTRDIEKIVESRYGKEKYFLKRYSGKYCSNCYSGWKYTSLFDEAGNLTRKKHRFKGRIRADYLYEYDTTANKITNREIINDNVNGHKGEWMENRFLLDKNNETEELKIWSFSSDSSKKLIIVETQIKRDSLSRITSYYRYGFDLSGDKLDGVEYVLYYDSKSRLIQIDENSIGSKTMMVQSERISEEYTFVSVPITSPEPLKSWIYKYSDDGKLLVEIALKYLGDIYKYDDITEDIVAHRFEFDGKGNWIRKYRVLTDSEDVLIADRKIKYR